MRVSNPFTLPGAALALACAAGPAAAAPLTNGDFSAGFDAWVGQTIACSLCDGSDDLIVDLDPPPGAFGANLDASTGGALLSTSFVNDGVYWVELRQAFDVGDLMGRATGLELVLDITRSLTGPFDLAIAQLTDPAGGLNSVDLLDGGAFDITGYAGRAAEISFIVADFDDSVDTLTIDNIRVDQVPVPAPLTLLAVGLGLLAGRRRAVSQPPADQE
jgi:hypothetical protein